MNPQRIQYPRGSKAKGWHMPEGSVYIGRPHKQDAAWFADPMSGPAWGRWGNPYTVEQYGRDEAVRLHREWVLSSPERVAAVVRELSGRVLVCWCRPGEACHGDVLLAIANGGLR